MVRARVILIPDQAASTYPTPRAVSQLEIFQNCDVWIQTLRYSGTYPTSTKAIIDVEVAEPTIHKSDKIR